MKFCFFLLLFVVCGRWSPADELAAEVARCAAIADPAERLAAYDALAAQLRTEAEAPREEVAQGMGKWTFEIDSLENGKGGYFYTYYVLTLSAEPVPGQTGEPPLVRVILDEDDYGILILPGVRLEGETVLVATRLDQRQPVVGKWSISGNNESVRLARDARRDVMAMTQAQTLYVRIRPAGKPPIDLTFDIRGLAEGVRTMEEASKRGDR